MGGSEHRAAAAAILGAQKAANRTAVSEKGRKEGIPFSVLVQEAFDSLVPSSKPDLEALEKALKPLKRETNEHYSTLERTS